MQYLTGWPAFVESLGNRGISWTKNKYLNLLEKHLLHPFFWKFLEEFFIQEESPLNSVLFLLYFDLIGKSGKCA